MIILSVFLFLLAILAFLPLFLVVLGSYEGGVLEKFDQFLGAYDGLILSIGTLALVSALATLSTHLSNVSSEKQQRTNRKVSAELKIVEFRQQWINDLRDDISELLSLSGKPFDSDSLTRWQLLNVRIHLRLNPDEEFSEIVMTGITDLLAAACADNREKIPSAQTNLQISGSRLLKFEWDRLKDDLIKAQILVGQNP